MQFFEYPYVIITILAMICLLMGCIGLYFTMKSARTTKGTGPKTFCSMSRIESRFAKAGLAQEKRCVMYISLTIENMRRVYSESQTQRMYERIQRILLQRIGRQDDGDVCLYGDDAFVAFCHRDDAEVIPLIERCFDEVNAVFVAHGAVGVVHIRFGYHLSGATDVSFKTALARAKQACSIAKDQAVVYCRWESSLGKEFERKISIENSIRSEIDNNHFFLEYQPLVDAKSGAIVGAEVLSRLNSSTEGIVAPNVFLSAVNHERLDQKFDYYILEKTCKWIAADRDRRMQHVYTVNFSRQTLCNPDLADHITAIMEEYGIADSCIAVEILEDKSLESEEKAVMIRNLATLKSKGVLILLDDFGKGSTSFNDLTDFDIDIVKIDQSITQMADQPSGAMILRSIIQTARNLGFRTLCEGVETTSQRQAAIDAGCDMLQGFGCYRPMPVSQFESLFDEA